MPNDNQLRNLSHDEITCLESHGCTSDDWSLIAVSLHGFRADRICHTEFLGRVELQRNDGFIIDSAGVKLAAGIRHARISHSVIGENVVIEYVTGEIHNYRIGDFALLRNIGTLSVRHRSSFGNGVIVNTLNESGHRSVMIHEQLSAQEACARVLLHDFPEFIADLQRLSENFAHQKSSEQGEVGQGAILENCPRIFECSVGAYATISGVRSLINGTIVSSKQSPTRIGDGTIAENFIVSRGSIVDNQSIIRNCFIGECCEVGDGFTLEHSLVFANSILKNGEGCSLFAGPHTVSHHKSTLLIALMTSFFNAGSGSNQSNHRYRLGAIHQGITERGTKLGSGSYLLLPTHIGLYSTVLGSVKRSVDFQDLPFTRIVASDENIRLYPAINLKNSGLYRDFLKWRKRDNRPADPLDIIDYHLFTPYVLQQITRGLNTLQSLEADAGGDFHYQGAFIPQKAYFEGIKLYAEILECCRPTPNERYIELAGVSVLRSGLESLMQQKHDSIESFRRDLQEIIVSDEYFSPTPSQREYWLEKLKTDLLKEFSPEMQIGCRNDFEQTACFDEAEQLLQDFDSEFNTL